MSQDEDGQKQRDVPSSNLQTTSPSVPIEETWNHPRSNISKTFATFWSFLIMGANDSAYGVIKTPANENEKF